MPEDRKTLAPTPEVGANEAGTNKVAPNNVEPTAPANAETPHNSARRYTVTPEKNAANRENAKNATGPRTPEGKAAVSQNALLHGLAAKVIRSAEILGESSDDFDSLLSEFYEVEQPVGKQEESIVQEMAVVRFREIRALRAEQAEIERDQLEADNAEMVESYRLYTYATQFSMLFTARFDVLGSLTSVRALCHQCEEALQKLKAGEFDQHALRDIDTAFGYALREEKDPHKLEQALVKLQEWLAEMVVPLAKKHELRKVGMSLPSGPLLDRVVRYEAPLNRQMARLRQRLEILQQRRRDSEKRHG
jgi:hypothetical protein